MSHNELLTATSPEATEEVKAFAKETLGYWKSLADDPGWPKLDPWQRGTCRTCTDGSLTVIEAGTLPPQRLLSEDTINTLIERCTENSRGLRAEITLRTGHIRLAVTFIRLSRLQNGLGRLTAKEVALYGGWNALTNIHRWMMQTGATSNTESLGISDVDVRSRRRTVSPLDLDSLKGSLAIASTLVRQYVILSLEQHE